MTSIPVKSAQRVASDKPMKNPRLAAYFRSGAYLSIVSVVLYFIVWFTITRDGLGLIQPIKFPSPLMVLAAAEWTADLIPYDLAATLCRIAAGLLAGTALGLGLGISYNRKLQYFFDQLIESMRPVPVIAMIPFFLMWFVIDEIGKFLRITLGVFAIVVVSTVEAVKSVSKIFILASQTLGASKYQMFRTVILPAIAPELVGPLRVATALSFTLVVAAEFMGAKAGLGYRILEARRMFNTDVIMLGVILIGLVAAVADTLLRRIAGHITRWSDRAG